MAKGVPYVPLKKRKLEFVNENIQLNAADKVIDLGCGDGRVLRLFGKQGVSDLTGNEINLWAYLVAIVKNKLCHSRAKIHLGNFYKANLAQYDVVFCYLMPNVLSALREKFDRELRPGAKVVSCGFEIKDWKNPMNIFKVGEFSLFVYQI